MKDVILIQNFLFVFAYFHIPNEDLLLNLVELTFWSCKMCGVQYEQDGELSAAYALRDSHSRRPNLEGPLQTPPSHKHPQFLTSSSPSPFK